MNRTMTAAFLALGVAGCDTGTEERPRITAGRASTEPTQPIPPGTAPQGTGAYLAVAFRPPPVTAALLDNGRTRYEVFCAPCHGSAGAGDGPVVQRGFPAPPSFHDERLRGIAPERIVEVVAQGVGTMYGFAERVPPEDRWAIGFYVKALQLSPRFTAAEPLAAPGERQP